MQIPLIDYELIAAAIKHYHKLDYKSISTSQLVSPTSIYATMPKDGRQVLRTSKFGPFGEFLVGSAEQGFVELMLTKPGVFKPNAKYQSTGMCFRDEALYDAIRYPWFMKTELMLYMPENDTIQLEEMIWDVAEFLKKYTHIKNYGTVGTPDGVDITYRGVEIGSYGVREFGEHRWIYGTGLALPRFSVLHQGIMGCDQ